MPHTILITGATDGIGLETARTLLAQGHEVLLHGRNPDKLESVAGELSAATGRAPPPHHVADLSRLSDAEALARSVIESGVHVDVLINNAGVYKTSAPVTPDGLDVRFAVNTLAPFLLTRSLLPHLAASARVVNVASAAQSPVDLQALAGQSKPADAFEAYAQSKLAMIMWSRALADSLGKDGPVIVAVNPGSLLATRMVKEGFGVPGKDIGIGADILARAALSDEFASATGQYFDNDSGRFAPPHAHALDQRRCSELVRAIENRLDALT